MSSPGRINALLEQLESRRHLAANLPAVADAYVRDGSYAGSNFGASSSLVAKTSAKVGSSRETHVRFNIASTSIAAGQTVKLRLYGKLSDTLVASLPAALYPVANTTWSESAITWNTRPAASSPTSLDSKTISGTSGKWYEWDVTNYVLNLKASGAGAVAFVLRSTNTSGTQIVFNSEENSANDPVLHISDPATGTITTTIPIGTAAYVRGGTYASQNFGSDPTLVAKLSATASDVRESYLKIDLSGVSTISSAKLRLYGGLSTSSSAGVQVGVFSSGNTSWTEGGITYSNRPASSTTPLATVTLTSSTKRWHEWNLTSFLQSEKAAGRDVVTLVLKALTNTEYRAIFNADDATSDRPQLLVQSSTSTSDPLAQQLDAAVAFAQQQYRNTVQGLANNAYPLYTRSDGTWKIETVDHWTVSFLPGTLWQLYQRTGDTFWRDQATARTLPLAGQAAKNDDVTFRIFNSYRPLYAQSNHPAHRQVLLDSAASKNTQWNETVGAYRTSWRPSTSGDPRANYGVLLDQSMDMELMFWAAKETGNQLYYDRAVRHLQKVAAHLIRPDGGTFHWAYFYDQTGEFISGETYQGYSHDSTWARGQAWAIYAFTTAHRETGRAEFLTAARKLADYFLARLPADSVPFWDFDDPAAPNTYRDSSAASITASALVELSRLLRAGGNATAADSYLGGAKRILSSLSSAAYLAQGTVHRGVLLHGALNVPANVAVDSSLIFGDYYFVEAAQRYAANAGA